MGNSLESSALTLIKSADAVNHLIGLQLRANRCYGQCCGSFSLAPLYQSCLNCWREEYRGVVDSYLLDIQAVRFPLRDYPCVQAGIVALISYPLGTEKPGVRRAAVSGAHVKIKRVIPHISDCQHINMMADCGLCHALVCGIAASDS